MIETCRLKNVVIFIQTFLSSVRLRKIKSNCVLSVLFVGNEDNDRDNSNKIVFTLKYTKLYLPVFTLFAKGNQKLSKLLSKEFKSSVYWNEYIAKSGSEDTTN